MISKSSDQEDAWPGSSAETPWPSSEAVDAWMRGYQVISGVGENMVQDQFSIYQVKAGRKYRPYRFHAYTYMLQHGLAITEDHYDLVYTSPLYPGVDPDLIRKRLNEKRPKSFSGHSISTGDVIAINQAGVTQYYYLEQVGFVCLPDFIQPSYQSSESNSRKSTDAVDFSGDAKIITLRTTDYLLKGRNGLWLAEDMLLVDNRPFFLLQHQDFGNDAAFAVVDEYGNQAAADSYDGFTDDVIKQIRQYLQKEKKQKAQDKAGVDRHDRARNAYSTMPAQSIEESIQPSTLQLSKSAPPLENWQKSYQNGEYIRSAESGEEANYNMVDGLHNNRRKRKKGKKRRSVLKRLHEKQLEVARREKKFPQQELPQFMQEQEIERKPKK